MPLRIFFRRNLAFFIPVLLLVATGIVFLVIFPKDVIHITQNSWTDPRLDSFFKYMTHMGDYTGLLPVGIVLLFVRWRYVVGLIVAAALTLMLTSFFKEIVFADSPRPQKYFKERVEDLAKLHFVDGVKMMENSSFPSGHTTTAFACYGLLALLTRHKRSKLGLVLIAALVGYSRIYLSQHFLADVVAGTILGTFIAILSFYLMFAIQMFWPRFHPEGKPPA